jgi:hypothetical protein
MRSVPKLLSVLEGPLMSELATLGLGERTVDSPPQRPSIGCFFFWRGRTVEGAAKGKQELPTQAREGAAGERSPGKTPSRCALLQLAHRWSPGPRLRNALAEPSGLRRAHSEAETEERGSYSRLLH